MLSTLCIDNIAVIEHAEMEFGKGLVVLTGETGAGKSIVIDSLEAITGSRADRSLIRTGAQSASITAVFDYVADTADEKLKEYGIENDDGQLIITRKLGADGKNSCRVNGVPVTVSQLKEIGSQLIDIHGQHEGQKLLDEGTHLYYLDSYAALKNDSDEYFRLYKAYCDTKAELKALEMSEEEKQFRYNMLSARIEELEAAELKPDEEQPLLERSSVLKNAEKLISLIDEAYKCMYGGEDSNGALSLIEQASENLNTASRISDRFSDIAENLRNLRYAADDASELLRDARAELDFTPAELDAIESRISQLQKLQRKYRCDISGLIELLDKSKAELEGIESADEKAEMLRHELDRQKQAAYNAAMKLSQKRQEAALGLSARINSELRQLNMPSAVFKVEFNKSDLDASGIDSVRFLMTANTGEDMNKLSRVASGGELSRIMLALKNVIAEHDCIGTMVFDEIDSGVSGVAAQRVGEKMSDLGCHRQVICVTHLPQIAAMADSHFLIEKNTDGIRTYTSVSPLDDSGRVKELARLTGGENITETTLKSAREQLLAARAYKERKM